MLEKEYELYQLKRSSNRKELSNTKYCGCENCGTLFNPKLITGWIEEDGLDDTAKCPLCYCDDVIPLEDEINKSITLMKDILAYSRGIDVFNTKINIYEPPESGKGHLKVKVIKGTNQIGGCITEIESDKARIIIDFGEDLEEDKKQAEKVVEIEGLTYGTPKYDAVFITHSHADHIGLINHILPGIPIYVEEKSQMIYELTCDFTNKECNKNTEKVWYHTGEKEYQYIPVKDMKVKYYTVDHSAYNSSMLLIECGDKRILHTGDFRNHGYKGKLFIPTLKKIGKVDLLITEGTCFSRDDNEIITEENLKDKATDLFRKYNQVFLLQSSTNIDRITSFFKASLSTKKKFIQDAFTANITLRIGGSIPNPTFNNNNVSVWIPQAYNKNNNKSLEFKRKYLEPIEKYKRVENVYKDYTMMVKTSMYEDIKLLYDKGKITNACLVYSMWSGYLNKPKMKRFVQKVKALGIEIKYLHTSGHADIETVKKAGKILNPDKVITIHTTNKERAKEIFNNAEIIDDGMQIKI